MFGTTKIQANTVVCVAEVLVIVFQVYEHYYTLLPPSLRSRVTQHFALEYLKRLFDFYLKTHYIIGGITRIQVKIIYKLTRITIYKSLHTISKYFSSTESPEQKVPVKGFTLIE